MEGQIFITGHRNPDTDSICSAIAYADLKRKLGVDAIPARLGQINKETEFVLKYFDVKLPDILTTVRTQVSDLKIDMAHPVSPDISLQTAWMMMKKSNLKVIPVVDDNDRLMGIVTLSDITSRYMDTMESNIIASSRTPLKNIVDVLYARLICGSQEDFNTTGKVVIAAMSPEEMKPFIEPGDIVLVGNRKDSQLEAIELGSNCIILTCGGQMDQDVLEQAKARKCIVMSTSNDTFTTARLINQSVPVGPIMTTENIISFNIHDFVDDIKDEMLQTRFRSYPVIDSDGRIKGFISRYHLISQYRKKIILLDHNEKTQTVDGVEQADIIEIIDHHRLGDIQTGNPIFVKNEPVGSTSTIIGSTFFENGIRPSKKMAGIMCAAIISDTIMFKSPTSTHLDKSTSEKLAKIAGIRMDEFSHAMFKAGSMLLGMTTHELLYNDFKDFNLGKHKIGIGQVNTMDMESIKDIKAEMVQFLEEVCNERKYSLLLLMITDIIHEGSEVFFSGRNKGLLAKAFDVQLKDGSTYLDGVVSRKKQLVPKLAAVME